MHARAGALRGRGQRRGEVRADRVREADVRDESVVEERGDATLREVDELIDDDEIAGRDVLLSSSRRR